jgi:hypothetical protein
LYNTENKSVICHFAVFNILQHLPTPSNNIQQQRAPVVH